MNRYPVSNGEAIASNWPDNENRINYLKTHFYEGEQQYSLDENFVEDFPAINFLNSKIEIKAINFTKRVIVPIYLNNISNGSMNERNHTNENYNLSVLSYNSSTTKFTNFSLYYTHNNATKLLKTNSVVYSKLNVKGYANFVNNDFQFNLGYSDNATQTNIYDILSNNKYNSNYMILLTNYNIGNIGITDNSDLQLFSIKDTTSANMFAFKSTFNSNNNLSNLIKYKGEQYTNFFFIWNSTDDNTFSFMKVIDGKNAIKVNTIGISIPETTKITISDDFNITNDIRYQINYMNTNLNNISLEGKGLEYNPVLTISEFTDLKLNFSLTTTDVKTYFNALSENYVCGKLTITLKNNVTSIQVFSMNIIVDTIFLAENFKGEFVVDGFSFIINNISEIPIQRNIIISICNFKYKENLFSITEIKFMTNSSKNVIYHYLNTTNPFIGGSSPKAIAYTSPIILSSIFSNKRNSFSELVLDVSFDWEVFRNMKAIIKFDKQDFIKDNLQINSDIKMNCYAYFKVSSNLNHLFETCEINLSLDSIIITTENKVLLNPGNIPKIFQVRITPVKTTNLSSINFRISVGFNSGQFTSAFPDQQNKSMQVDQIESTIPMQIDNSIYFIDILPHLDGFKGIIEVQINLLGNNPALTFINNNSLNISEIGFLFPTEYYGTLDEDYQCFINGINIENCFIKDEWIYIREHLNINQINTFTIYGINVRDYSVTSNVYSSFLVNLNSIENNISKNWLYGIGAIKANFNLSVFNKPNVENINLALLSQSTKQSQPNAETSITLDYMTDRIVGLKSSNLNILDLNESDIYIEVPKNVRLNDNVDLKAFYYEYSKTTANENVEEDVSIQNQEYNKVELAISQIVKYGKVLKTQINGSYQLNDKLRKITFEISGLITPKMEEMTYPFKVAIVSKEAFFTNFSLLLTNNSLFNNYDTLSLNKMNEIYLDVNLKENSLINKYNNIEYFRGLNFENADNRIYFEMDQNQTNILKAGVYNNLNLVIKTKGIIENFGAVTSININKKFNRFFFTPANEEYIVRAAFTRNIKVKIGVTCKILSGSYILSLEHGDTSNKVFSPLFPWKVQITDESNMERIMFNYFNNQPYLDSRPIEVAKGGIVYFFLLFENPPVNDITVKFERDEESGTTIPPPENFRISSNVMKNRYILNYSMTDPKNTRNQKYFVNVTSDNTSLGTCYKINIGNLSKPYIQFSPEYDIVDIDKNLSLENVITYSPESTLLKNEIKFIFDTRHLKLPRGLNIFCSLTCSGSNLPRDDYLTKLPLPENDSISYEKFFYYPILSTEPKFSYTFSNLQRDKSYDLKCIVQTSNSRNELNTRSSIVLQNAIFKPANTVQLMCIEIVLSTSDNKILQENIHSLIQNLFIDNWEMNGCITVLNQDNKSIYEMDNDLSVKCPNIIRDSVDKEILSKNTTLSTNNTINYDSKSNKTRRYLQGSNSTMSNNITNTTVITNEKQFNYKYCLIQSRKCTKDPDVNKVKKTLEEYFKESFINTKSTQNPNTIVKVTTSKFKTNLSKDFQNQYITYNFLYSNPTLLKEMILNIEVDDRSDFRIKNNDVKINMLITYEQPGKLVCFYGFSNLAQNSVVTITKSDVINCNKQKLFLCGDANGEVISDERLFSRFIKADSLGSMDYMTLYAVCKENLPIVIEYSEPIPIYSTKVLIVSSSSEILPDKTNNTNFKCEFGSPIFPGCCPLGIEEVKKGGVEIELKCISSMFIIFKQLILLMLVMLIII